MPILTIYDPERQEIIGRTSMPQDAANRLITAIAGDNRLENLKDRKHLILTVQD